MTMHTRLTRRSSRGFSLIVVLLILVVVTLLGSGAAQMSLLSERTTRFDRDNQVAWQSAESALMDAEFDIRGPIPAGQGNPRISTFSPDNKVVFADGCGTSSATRGLCLPKDPALKPIWAQVDFTDTSSSSPSVAFGTYTGRSYASGSTGVQPAHAPRYIIEMVDNATLPGECARVDCGSDSSSMYRVTAIGFGPREETQIVLQMLFRKENL